jgi:hypothetical protein
VVVDPEGTVVAGVTVVDVVGTTEVDVVDDVLEVVVVATEPETNVFTCTESFDVNGSVGAAPDPARSINSFPTLAPGGTDLWTTKITLAPDASPAAGT